MGVLDKYKDWFNSYFSEWIRINDKFSGWTIEDFPYNMGVDRQQCTVDNYGVASGDR